MTYKIINTGSDGNAVIIENILIDCGVSFKKLKDHYKKISVVFLTHIHTDHFNRTTIKKLSQERPTLRFGACEWLIQDLVNCGVNKKNIDILEIGKTYNYNLFEIKPIRLYHDVENCGYMIFKENKKGIYITDTNTLDGIEAKDFDLYLVEANYEEEIIDQRIKEKEEKGQFAYEYRAKNSHLSKEKTNEWLIANMGENSQYEYLHVSKEREKHE